VGVITVGAERTNLFLHVVVHDTRGVGKDEAREGLALFPRPRRIAVNVAKLPELVRKP